MIKNDSLIGQTEKKESGNAVPSTIRFFSRSFEKLKGWNLVRSATAAIRRSPRL